MPEQSGQRRMPRARRRAQLLMVATSHFGSRGYHATSMDDIAAGAGVTKPVLYQHFTSKEELYLAVVADLGEALQHAIAEVADLPGHSTVERAERGVKAFVDLVARPGATFKLFFGQDSISPRIVEAVDSILRGCAQQIADMLTTHRVIPTADAQVLGSTLATLVQAAAAAYSTDDDSHREHAANVVASFIAHGLMAYPARDPNRKI
ncbi:TetR/AcrR family transcriptional regulator [Devriesea agamarum]|uniref:TetR/AcrR family transcriptional regulator n=1 Tax=Devriesea agamarum TaxID=472569 RepID=UPI00071D24D7|nr:TetR/AcrR family transcriptional regulator [Devriesea agamarum]